MRINVYMNTKTFGGYGCEDFHVRTEYEDSERGASDWLDFGSYPEYAKRLRKLLLGQAAPVSFGYKFGKDKEFVVLKGETIASLHIKKIMDVWHYMDFSKTPWAKDIDQLKADYDRQMLKEKLESKDVQVRFRYHNWRGAIQSGGSIQISLPVAKWLGERLIEAANGDLNQGGVSIRVRNDKQVSVVKRESVAMRVL